MVGSATSPRPRLTLLLCANFSVYCAGCSKLQIRLTALLFATSSRPERAHGVLIETAMFPVALTTKALGFLPDPMKHRNLCVIS
jgi:hypothetical protein